MSHQQVEPSTPMVTVVIPCHNHRQWVNDAIDSVVNQTYERRQIVVVDDGSTDYSSHAVLARLNDVQSSQEGTVPRQYMGNIADGVRLMLLQFPEGHGPSFARNAGIKAAWNYTDLFSFLDSDDMYEPEKLARSVAVWMADPGVVGVVYSDYTTWNPNTGLRLRQFKEPFSRQRLIQECVVNCDSLISKQAFADCGMFDEEMRVCEDFDLWMRISEKKLIVHIPESLVNIRVGNHSSTSQVQKDVWNKCYARVFSKAKHRVSQQ